MLVFQVLMWIYVYKLRIFAVHVWVKRLNITSLLPAQVVDTFQRNLQNKTTAQKTMSWKILVSVIQVRNIL